MTCDFYILNENHTFQETMSGFSKQLMHVYSFIYFFVIVFTFYLKDQMCVGAFYLRDNVVKVFTAGRVMSWKQTPAKSG